MSVTNAPKLKNDAQISENSPWRRYRGDVRIWVGLLLIPLILYSAAVIFRFDKKPAIVTAQACDFHDWVGHTLNMQALHETKRPYRFIAKGGTMTPTGDDTLMNIELDGTTVLNVWCG